MLIKRMLCLICLTALLGNSYAQMINEMALSAVQNKHLQKIQFCHERTYLDSMGIYIDSLQMANANNNTAVYFEVSLYKATLFGLQNNTDSASFYTSKSEQIAQEYKNNIWLIRTKIHEGNLLQRQGKIANAITAVEGLNALVKNIKDTNTIADYYTTLSKYYLGSDDENGIEKAIQFVFTSIRYTEDNSSFKRKNYNAKYLLAYCCFAEEKYDTTLTLTKQCSNYYLDNNANRNYLMCQMLVARCYSRLKKVNESESILMKCLEFAKKISDYDMNKMSYNALVELEENRGDYKKALEWNREYQEYNDTINSEKNKLALATAKISYEKQLKDLENNSLKKEVTTQKSILGQYKNLFIFTSIFFLIGGLSYFIYNNVREKKQLMLQKQMETENSLKHLRAQLNPHFMQNLFNTIYLQVANDTGVEKVRMFIHEISYFFRNVLLLNEQNMHSLQDELSFINNYLLLQQKICSGTLTWQINVADEVNEELINIPTMLLQPIIENAIKHGFVNGTRDGHIAIHVSIVDDKKKIICEVVDNGVGNQTKNEVNYGIGNTSVGLKNVEERLRLAKKAKSNEVVFVQSFTEKGGLVQLYL